MRSVFISFFITFLTLLFVVKLNHVDLEREMKNGTSTNFAQIDLENKPEKKVVQQESKPEPQKMPDLAPDLSQLIAGQNFGLEGFKVDLSALSDSLIGDASNVSMTEETVDVAPIAKNRPPLVFPEKARKMGVSGYVQLSLFVNHQGRVEKAKVLESQPPGVFEESALSAVKQWVFKPAEYQGNTVALWVKQRISFNLN